MLGAGVQQTMSSAELKSYLKEIIYAGKELAPDLKLIDFILMYISSGLAI